ncbi:PIN domain-containing protein, partial [Acidobacteria bacterium AH-259-O06]|nr:PIN domain-containing protein [Acidobacteria bacterium AH-259-O06]
MRFWDASAVVPLVVAEEQTSHCRSLLAQDTEMVVWLLTPLEVISALTRRLRQSSLKLPDFRRAKEQLVVLERAWSEVTSVESVRERARRLLETHSLRAADALQLAAAIIVSEDKPPQIPFVTLDNH